MSGTFRISASYKGFSQERDSAIRAAAGVTAHDYGSGFLIPTKTRDLAFEFSSKAEAEAAQKRISEIPLVVCKLVTGVN